MATADLPRDDLVKLIRVMQRDIDLLKMQSPLANTGLTIPGTGEVDVTGLLRVLGNLIVSGLVTVDATGGIQSSNYVSGTAGWRFDGTSLEANTGVIGNGALANPVIFASPRAAASGFALLTTYRTLASVTVTVPPGMTQLQVFVTARLFVYNPNSTGGSDGAGVDALYVQAQVAGNSSTATPTGISGSGGFATTVSSDSFTLTGLAPGATVTLAVQGATGFANLAANAGNYASVAAAVSWSR